MAAKPLSEREVMNVTAPYARALSGLWTPHEDPGNPYYDDTRERFYAESVVATPQTALSAGLTARVMADAVIYIKEESAQGIGSFKIRGAKAALLQAVRQDRHVQVAIAASAGNHIQGVIEAARGLHIPEVEAHIPEDTVPVKRKAVEAGATRVFDHPNLAEAQKAAALSSKQAGSVDIPPYDHPNVISGQSTVAAEIMHSLFAAAEHGEVDLERDHINLMVPAGGGGLAAGALVLLEALRQDRRIGPNVQCKIVQLRTSDTIYRTVNRMERLNQLHRYMGATNVVRMGRYTLPLLRAHRRNGILVDEGNLGQALWVLEQHHGYAVEPAGALALAGVIHMHAQQRHKPESKPLARQVFVAVTSGRNGSEAASTYFYKKAGVTQAVGRATVQLAREVIAVAPPAQPAPAAEPAVGEQPVAKSRQVAPQPASTNRKAKKAVPPHSATPPPQPAPRGEPVATNPQSQNKKPARPLGRGTNVTIGGYSWREFRKHP